MMSRDANRSTQANQFNQALVRCSCTPWCRVLWLRVASSDRACAYTLHAALQWSRDSQAARVHEICSFMGLCGFAFSPRAVRFFSPHRILQAESRLQGGPAPSSKGPECRRKQAGFKASNRGAPSIPRRPVCCSLGLCLCLHKMSCNLQTRPSSRCYVEREASGIACPGSNRVSFGSPSVWQASCICQAGPS